MSKELTKDLTAVLMMSGVVIWVEAERATRLRAVLSAKELPRFVEFEGQLINTSSIEGVYSAATMEEMEHRKKGQWQCKYGSWHDRKEACECKDPATLKKRCEQAVEHYRARGFWPRGCPSRAEIEEVLGKGVV